MTPKNTYQPRVAHPKSAHQRYEDPKGKQRTGMVHMEKDPRGSHQEEKPVGYQSSRTEATIGLEFEHSDGQELFRIPSTFEGEQSTKEACAPELQLDIGYEATEQGLQPEVQVLISSSGISNDHRESPEICSRFGLKPSFVDLYISQTALQIYAIVATAIYFGQPSILIGAAFVLAIRIARLAWRWCISCRSTDDFKNFYFIASYHLSWVGKQASLVSQNNVTRQVIASATAQSFHHGLARKVTGKLWRRQQKVNKRTVIKRDVRLMRWGDRVRDNLGKFTMQAHER